MKRVPLIKMLAGTALALAVVSTPVIAGDSSSKDKKEALYPNATRKEPKLDLTSEKDQKAINEGLDAVNNQDKEKAIQILQPIADGSKSKYAQALALQGLANVHYNDGDVKGAIDLLKRALDNGTMPNDTFFQLEYMLAQFYLADEQYQQCIDTVEKWRAEGKKETADSYALEGNAYYRLGKYPEAIAAIKTAQSKTDKPNDSWNQILVASYSESGQGDQAAQIAQQQLAANPNDPNALNNAVAALMQAQKYPEAISLMEKAKANGQLKTEKDYITLAKLYLVTGQNGGGDQKDLSTKAAATLQDGMSKGIVTQTAENYELLGAANYMSDNTSGALAAYQKAIPLAKDGEAHIRAGQLLIQDNKFSEAKSLIQQGIDKGVQHKGTAYMLLAQACRGLKDKAGAIAAMEKAAQDPETSEKAKAWLKSPTVSK
ncbi:Tetratricopeptide repeat-containing protein [Dyella jiangningensis]|uniref:tetratricopeptide repeat protein n=1 Tax=Dyella sp. AtDHG13 TaxID=1938897 RepID=UPI0008897123|nr:tetratricopeptide repeat protein [Dyella sp. AtDHG13]PXV56950.1 tetratricopeptide repeat protein [Dyella sp. AtDHG13]SDK61993.1 Tetratricopeptide repeat-containing protein [Dyella jiangningensis]